MKYQVYEVERIATAERMLADRASATLEKLARDVAAACGISIKEMQITLRLETDHTPEPKAHFVITGGEISGQLEREAMRMDPGRAATYGHRSSSPHRQ